MSKLKALLGKPTKITIGELELEINPLRLDQMELFTPEEGCTKEEQAKKMNELIRTVLKESVPDATDEELSGISIEYMNPLMDAIMKVNKFQNLRKKLRVPPNVRPNKE